MTEFLADGPDWHLRSWFCSGLSLFSAVDMRIGSSKVFFQRKFNSWGYGADEEACGCAKTFPDIPDVSQIFGGLLCGAAIRMKASTSLQKRRMFREYSWLTGNVGIYTAYRFSVLEVLWIVHTVTSFCSSCTLPDNSIIVFRSSMSFRLAIVSMVELWNFRTCSISARLCWWTSRESFLLTS